MGSGIEEREQCTAQPTSRSLRTATTGSKALMWMTSVPVVSSFSGILPSPHQNPLCILLVCLNRVPIQTGGSLRPFFRSLPCNLWEALFGTIAETSRSHSDGRLSGIETQAFGESHIGVETEKRELEHDVHVVFIREASWARLDAAIRA